MLIDDGLARARERALAGRGRPGRRSRPADDPRAARGTSRSAGRRGAGTARASRGRRQALPSRIDRDADERGSQIARLGAARCARSQGADTTRQAGLRRRGRLPLSPPAHPRRGVRVDPEVGSRRPPRTSRGVARGEGRASEEVEYDEILGYHLEQAYRFRAELGEVDEEARAVGRRAAERLGAAGKRAFARLDSPAAMNLMSRATALLPNDDPLRVDLIPNVRAIQGAADLGWADAILQEAIASGDPRLRAHALVQRGFLRLFLLESEVTAEELIQRRRGRDLGVRERSDDQLGLARAWRLVSAIPLPRAKWTVERRGSRDRAELRAGERRPLRAAGDRRMARNRARAGSHDGSRGGRDLPAIAGSAGRRSGDGAHPHSGPWRTWWESREIPRRPRSSSPEPGDDRGAYGRDRLALSGLARLQAGVAQRSGVGRGETCDRCTKA